VTRQESFPSPEKLRSKDILRLLARVWPFIAPEKRHLLYLLLILIPAVPTAVLALYLFPIFLDVVGNGHPLTLRQAWLLRLPLHATREAVLFRACIVAGVAGLIIIPATFATFAYAIWILQRISNRFRVALYDRLQELSLRFHGDEKIGDAIFRMFQDAAAIPQVINGLVVEPIRWLPFAVAMLLWLAISNYTIALIALALVPADIALALAFAGTMRRAFLREREATALATTTIEETLASVSAVKAFGTETRESARYSRDNWNAFLAARRARMTFAGYRVLITVLRALAYVTVLYIAAHQVLTGARGGMAHAAISLGLFQAAVAAFSRMSGGARHLTDVWGSLQDVGIALARVFEMLDRAPERAVISGTAPVAAVRESFAFENCGFSYDGRAQVLAGVSLTARIGDITAIVGESGSGKSTMLALALRFFDPTAGQIALDGADIRGFDLTSYRSLLSVAFQESPLFTATIRENILYGRPDASADEIAAAIELAQLCDFVRSLPAGLDTMLGEKGAKISAGQAQRITIARAILRDAPILLLDEPTSALDLPTEERLMAALRAWVDQRPTRRMVLLATHRESTAAMADRVYEIAGGRMLVAEHDQAQRLAASRS
jgi:ABC-type multidrug transport system fused ATPase/permease subunit